MKKNNLIPLTGICFVTLFFFSGQVMAFDRFPHLGIPQSFAPAPTLLYPTTDNINLSGKEFLEFKWERSINVRIDHYIFKLYKGYNTTASYLISQKDVDMLTYPIKVPAKEFESGQVYTWSLQGVFWDGSKTERAFSSFKVIAK